MTDTANLGLPFIEAGQAQKHVTHNEALRILDAAIQIAVQDITRTAPPPSPAEGQRHVVASSPTGAWAGRAKAIATWQDGAWAFLVPKNGWCVWSIADAGVLVFDGTSWRDIRGLGFDNLVRLGVNTAASAPNLLSVKSNAALFAAINAADGGSGDVRVQLSKESAAKTASIYFADAYSGRAEFGLVGSDAFKLKVSSDGSSWVEALSIDHTSGALTLPRGIALNGVIAPPQITANLNDYAPTGFAAASVVQVSTDAARSISGLAGGADGRTIALLNIGTQTLSLLSDHAASAAANRFSLGGDVAIPAKQAVLLRYDGTAARWQALSRPSSGAGGLLAANNLSDLANAAAARSNLGVRDVLSAARTYYVRTDGSNANTGLANSSGGAFLTLQKALDVAATLDLNGFDVSIAVAAGTYMGAVSVSAPWVGRGTVQLIGDVTTPANVLLSGTGTVVSVYGGGTLSIAGFKVTTSGGAALRAFNYGTLIVTGRMDYGAASQHMYADYGGVINVGASYAISGGAGFHWLVKTGGRVMASSLTITINGTPAFSGAFAYAAFTGIAEVSGNTFSGVATGVRFYAETAGGLVTGGGGATYLPGSAAGTTTSPGWYQ